MQSLPVSLLERLHVGLTITRDWGTVYVPTCVCESAGEALAHRVSCLAPVSISHIDTSLFPCTAEIIQDG